MEELLCQLLNERELSSVKKECDKVSNKTGNIIFSRDHCKYLYRFCPLTYIRLFVVVFLKKNDWLGWKHNVFTSLIEIDSLRAALCNSAS